MAANEYLRTLPQWPLGQPLPATGLLHFYDFGTDKDYRVLPGQVGGGSPYVQVDDNGNTIIGSPDNNNSIDGGQFNTILNGGFNQIQDGDTNAIFNSNSSLIQGGAANAIYGGYGNLIPASCTNVQLFGCSNFTVPAGTVNAQYFNNQLVQAGGGGSATLYAFTGTAQAPQAVVQGAFYYLPGQVLAKRVGASGDATTLDPSDTANWEAAGPVLPVALDIYGASVSKRQQVMNFFAQPNPNQPPQYYADDQPLSVNGVPDTSTGQGSIIDDVPGAATYRLTVDRNRVDANNNYIPVWLKQALP